MAHRYGLWLMYILQGSQGYVRCRGGAGSNEADAAGHFPSSPRELRCYSDLPMPRSPPLPHCLTYLSSSPCMIRCVLSASSFIHTPHWMNDVDKGTHLPKVRVSSSMTWKCRSQTEPWHISKTRAISINHCHSSRMTYKWCYLREECTIMCSSWFYYNYIHITLLTLVGLWGHCTSIVTVIW